MGPFTWIFGTGRTEIFQYGLRSEVSYRLHARPVWDFSTLQLLIFLVILTVPKVQYGPENSYKRKEISVRGGCSTFYRADYNRTKRNYWNGFFLSFLTTGEVLIFEICVNIRPAKVLRPPRTEIENSARTETHHVNKTETQNGLDLRPYRKSM